MWPIVHKMALQELSMDFVCIMSIYAESKCTFHLIYVYHFFPDAEFFRNAQFGEGDPFSPIFLDRLVCHGNEEQLLSCDSQFSFGLHQCDHSEDAGVACQGM